MVNIRSKGQRGEREAIDVIEGWAAQVTEAMGLPPVVMERNLEQTRTGGYDVLGIDWLAIEVKRHENLQVGTWWRQAVKQARPDQVPFLMYRQNRTPWRFRLQLVAAHYSPCGQRSTTNLLVADLDAEQAKQWFQHALWVRLSAPPISDIMKDQATRSQP